MMSTAIFTSFIFTFHLYSYQTLKVSTCLFQVNVMVLNMIIGTPYDEYDNTHLFHLHISIL